MNLLFVHEVDWLKKVVFELHHLAEKLSLKGHNVFAVDYSNEWKKENWFDMGTLSSKKIINVNRAFKDARVTLIRPGFIKLPGISRISAHFTHYRVIKRIIDTESIDAIILYSAPTNGIQTLKLAHKKGIPVLFRSIDILHQMVHYSYYSFLRYPTLFIERIVYSEADLILTLTPKLAEYALKMGATRDLIKLVPHGVDTKIFYPREDEGLKEKYGLDRTDKIILFLGTLSTFSGMDSFVKEFPKILKEIPETKLIIVGGGPIFERIRRLIRRLKISNNVILTGFQPHHLVPEYINLADICINPFHINEATKYILPNKITQYLACAKPVIATKLPGMSFWFQNKNYGVVYEENIMKMVQKIVFLLKNLDIAKEIGQKGFRYIIKKFDWYTLGNTYEKLILEAIRLYKAY